MPALAFRRRILLAMIVFGVLPTTLGIIGWAMALRNRAPAIAGRAAFEEVGATGRHFLRVLDTTRLTPEERAALREHTSELNAAMAQANRAEAFSRYRAIGITIVIIEHTMQAMVRLVDRFVVLNEGALLAQGQPAEITRNEAVIDAYLGKRWRVANA